MQILKTFFPIRFVLSKTCFIPLKINTMSDHFINCHENAICFLTLCKLRLCCLYAFYHRSQRPERQVVNGEKQPCRLVKYYCHYEYGIIVFVSGNICTCVHRTTFYEIMSITTIKHATESITLNIVSLLSMLMCLSNDIAHHNPSQYYLGTHLVF